ncbi:MAG TPA: hypothetical protein VFW98_06320 [Gemmatimonadaceae bacterium]|nr:hypothetical protein [Gemmatimonadaceae bacterium]
MGASVFPPQAPPDAAAFMIRHRVAIGVSVVVQTQYVAAGHVLTEASGQWTLFDGVTRTRYLVDRAARVLRRLDPPEVLAQVRALRATLGEPHVSLAGSGIPMRGHLCRRYILHVTHPRLSASTDAYVTTVPALAGTALHAARLLSQEALPFSPPLDPADLVVQSSIVLLQQQREVRQTVTLEALEAASANALLDECLAFRITI